MKYVQAKAVKQPIIANSKIEKIKLIIMLPETIPHFARDAKLTMVRIKFTTPKTDIAESATVKGSMDFLETERIPNRSVVIAKI